MVRIYIPLILIALTALSDAYIFHRYISHSSMWRWAWWIPMAAVIGFFVKFLAFNKGLIEDYNSTNLFLLVLVLCCIPKIFFAILAPIPKIGTYLGLFVAAYTVWMVAWGTTKGFSELKIRRLTYESADVPKAFDGYRIVQFSDTHTGCFRGPYSHLLGESMDSINALKPDLICFTGDIENFTPQEIINHKEAYSRLKATDGVLSIMGNHDYSSYIKVSERERAALVRETREAMRSFGWRILENEHTLISRGEDSIAVIGEENWGKKPFPQRGNIKRAIAGLDKETFSVMLSHDPHAWDNHILPVFQPNITLSGHTHGTQFSICGWSPASMIHHYWGGEYRKGNLLLYVSTGLGGNFPFRYGMPREIVLITLKHKPSKAESTKTN